MILDSRKRLRYRRRMKTRSRKSRRKARRNPLGPLTGRPVIAGVLAWLTVGAVGTAVAVPLLTSRAKQLPPTPSQTDLAPIKAFAQSLQTVIVVGQVVGAIAAYRAAKV